MTERDLQRWSEEVARDPGAPSFVRLARAYRRQGRRKAAREVVLRGLQHNPEHVEAHALLALVHLEAGERQNAGDEWAIIRTLEPANFDANRGLGFLALERGDLSDARRHLIAAAAVRPEDPAVRQALEVLERREDGKTTPRSDAARDPARVFETLRSETPFLGALVLDSRGFVLAGALAEEAGDGELLGALVSTAVEEAKRTARLTGVGAWRGLLVDCEAAVIHVATLDDGGALLLAARPGTPTGWVVRTAGRARSLASPFTGGAA